MHIKNRQHKRSSRRLINILWLQANQADPFIPRRPIRPTYYRLLWGYLALGHQPRLHLSISRFYYYLGFIGTGLTFIRLPTTVILPPDTFGYELPKVLRCGLLIRFTQLYLLLCSPPTAKLKPTAASLLQ